jgi:hypothetical protein
MCAPATDDEWAAQRMTATVSQLSHRLGGRHRIEADSLDIQRTLTCGSGFWRTGRTHGIDLRQKAGVRVPRVRLGQRPLPIASPPRAW